MINELKIVVTLAILCLAASHWLYSLGQVDAETRRAEIERLEKGIARP
jgi:hypothetical protein